jgi:hypothetical protein
MTDKPKLPVSGGSWTRRPDGSLEPATKISTPPTPATPSGPLASTARKGPKKET